MQRMAPSDYVIYPLNVDVLVWCAVLQVRLPEANVSASHEAGRRRMGDRMPFAGAPRVLGASTCDCRCGACTLNGESERLYGKRSTGNGEK